MNNLLAVKNIESAYGMVVAVRGVSFEVPEGAIVALIGSNGAGKSTVLKSIAGLVEPDKGKILFRDREIQGMAPDRVARTGICLVPEGREVFPLLSVLENLEVAAYVRRDRSGLAADIDNVFDMFPSLRDRRDQLAIRLSGGEQQMLAIGRALIARPTLLLLDEPSLGLSPKLVKDVFAIVRRIRDELGTTILLVEQNVPAALGIADFAYVMELGRIALSGTTAQLRERDDIQELYLGMKDSGVRGNKRWKRTRTWR